MIPHIYSNIKQYSTYNLCDVHKQYTNNYREHDTWINTLSCKSYFYRELTCKCSVKHVGCCLSEYDYIYNSNRQTTRLLPERYDFSMKCSI